MKPIKLQNRKAFTMLELTFVIVIIGILSAVAIPKFAMNRDDAVIAKAKNTVAAVRNSVATERQKRILRGKFKKIGSLAVNGNYGVPIFDYFDDNTSRVLEYPLTSCADSSARSCWKRVTKTTYLYKMPLSGKVTFTLLNNRFDCALTGNTAKYCKQLTQ